MTATIFVTSAMVVVAAAVSAENDSCNPRVLVFGSPNGSDASSIKHNHVFIVVIGASTTMCTF